MAKVAILKSLNEYLLLLAGDVAQRLVRLKLDDYNHNRGDTKPKSPFEDMYLSVEGDGRIANKVYEMLKNEGALSSFTSWRPEEPFNFYRSSSKKQPKRYSGVVSETWFNTFASANAVAPVFETSGLVTKAKDTWSTNTERVLKTELQNYQTLSGYNVFTDAEYLYIWLHLDEYDVRILKETHQGSSSHGFGSSTTEDKVIYPKNMLQDLSIGVFIGHAEDYVEKHIEWGMKHLLGLESVIINADVETSIEPRTEITEFKNWTEEFLLTQIKRAEDLQTHLSACKLSYGLLQNAVEKYGGWDKFREDSKMEFVKYLEECFPLHLGDDEPDEDLRELCETGSGR